MPNLKTVFRAIYVFFIFASCSFVLSRIPISSWSSHSLTVQNNQPAAVDPAKSLQGVHHGLKKERIIAVGDLHGDYDNAVDVLRMAGIVDIQENWVKSDQKTILVQTGDIVDRGPDTIKLYDLMKKLTIQANQVGDQVIHLLGNHEIMNMQEDLRYVTKEDYESFGGFQERRKAFAKKGKYGDYLRSLRITAIVGNAAFVHGGYCFIIQFYSCSFYFPI